MAAIREYNAAETGIQPTEIGIESTAAAARRIGQSFNQQAGSIERLGAEFGNAVRSVGDAATTMLAHQDVTRKSVEYVSVLANTEKTWNDTLKNNPDPNNTSIGDHFREEVLEPTLQKFQDGTVTQHGSDYTQKLAEGMREHMTRKVMADMSSRAGDAVAVNVATIKNQLSNVVREDASSLDHALSVVDGSIDNIVRTSPNLSGEHADSVRSKVTLTAKEDIVKSAVMGLAEKNPDAALKFLDNPKYQQYISGAEAKQVIMFARSMQRAKIADERLAQSELKRQQQQDAIDKHYQMLNEFALPDGTYKFPQNFVQRALSDPVLQKYPPALNDLISKYNMLERGQAGEKLSAVSNRTTQSLLTDMRRTDDDPQRMTSEAPIWQAVEEGRLTFDRGKELSAMFQQSRTPEGQRVDQSKRRLMASVKNFLDKSVLGAQDAEGPRRMYDYEQFVDQQVKLAGTSWPKLFNPADPSFIGSTAIIQQFSGSLQDRIKAMTDRMRGVATAPAPTAAPTARLPGESAEDWRKRMGSKPLTEIIRGQ